MLSCHLVAVRQKNQDKSKGLGPPRSLRPSHPDFWGGKERSFCFLESLGFPVEGEGPQLETDGVLLPPPLPSVRFSCSVVSDSL